MRRAPEPYVIAYVTLAEGPTMLTNIVGCDFDALRVGQPVRLAWVETQGGPPVPSVRRPDHERENAMRYGLTKLFGAVALAGFAGLPVADASAASAACSGTALTELRMSECLSPATRGIRPATQATPSSAPGSTAQPAASQPASGQAARVPAQASPGLDLEIKFPFGSAELGADSKALLQKLAHVLGSGELANRTIKVIGHTDAAGSDELNQALSIARAQAVSAYLAEQGVSGGRLQPTGVGKSDHKNPKDPMAAENRRVEIVPAG
eukprot:gene12411-12497_t